MSRCLKCGKALTMDEIGITRKLVNRGATEFYCKVCLANEFHCEVALIDAKITQFREMGCTLFVKERN